ncbi:uncharacterized protein TNCV_1124451 [Trichonephila clavipes]|uniref:Uncharacterized protein n=1 Tax=Trichonephila clavipes TaxID=2585209 RepID=A0A8X6SQ22_TRICX|nr:uncharacterized protein TNCV_1124451 [Trichonephila clavipes]
MDLSAKISLHFYPVILPFRVMVGPAEYHDTAAHIMTDPSPCLTGGWRQSRLYVCSVDGAAVAQWLRYQIIAVMSSSPVPLKTSRVGQRCTLNLSRAQSSSRWCGVAVRRGGASSGVVLVT